MRRELMKMAGSAATMGVSQRLSRLGLTGRGDHPGRRSLFLCRTDRLDVQLACRVLNHNN